MSSRSFPRSSLSTLALSALAVCGAEGAQAQSDQLVAAAKAEGQLTVIALARNWCGYGSIIDAFKAKYGIKVNELNPDAGSGDEVESIKANKDNKGPQAPDTIDVGLSFGPAAKAAGLLQPYKVSTWSSIPDSAKDPEGFWYGDYYGVLSFQVNSDLISKAPADWADLLKPEYKNSVALAGDPRSANQAIQGIYAAGLAVSGGDASKSAAAGLKFFADLNKSDHRALGLQRTGRPRHSQGEPQGGRGGAEIRRSCRCVRASHQRLRASPQRGKAVDGIPVL